MPETIEEWRPVVGTWGYEVSNLGNARCFRTMGGRSCNVPRPLTPVVGGRYRTINIDRRMRRVGTLVLEAFVGPRPADQECCHGPSGSLDDSLTNLSWGTHAKNMSDTARDGTNRPGEKTNLAKLTDDDVRNILLGYSQGVTIKNLAEMFGVCFGTVWHVVNRKTWKHVAIP